MQRQAAKRAELVAKRKRRNAILGATIAVVLTLGGIVFLFTALRDNNPDTVTPAAAGSSEPAATPTTAACSYTKSSGQSAARDVGVPPINGIERSGTATVTLATSAGRIELSLDQKGAPCTANSFSHLATSQYFDGTPCHRLTTSETLAVLQCGDPTGTGSGGPGYQFADENLEGATYPRGTVAMANSGPGTNGSQFFLVYRDSQLPPSYTPFGKVTGGLEVLDKVAKAGTDSGEQDGKPKTPVTISKATVSWRGGRSPSGPSPSGPSPSGTVSSPPGAPGQALPEVTR